MMNSYKYDIKQLESDLFLYSDMFIGLEQLGSYGPGKIGLYNDKTYISWYYFQGIQRFYYDENRYKLLQFLKTNIRKYITYYHHLTELYSLNNMLELRNLIKHNNLLLSRWKKGLNNLRKAYRNTDIDKELLSLLGEMAIDTL